MFMVALIVLNQVKAKVVPGLLSIEIDLGKRMDHITIVEDGKFIEYLAH